MRYELVKTNELCFIYDTRNISEIRDLLSHIQGVAVEEWNSSTGQVRIIFPKIVEKEVKKLFPGASFTEMTRMVAKGSET